MGKKKYLSEIEVLFAKSPVVSHSTIARIINDKKRVKQYVKTLIHNLLKRGKIKRLTKGYYTSFDDASLAVFCFQPAYLGLQDALSFHNLWEQETIPVIITTKNVRPGIRNVLGKNVLLRRIEKKYYFGIEYQQQEKAAFPYSDIEKTFIDMVYYKENLNNEAITAIKKTADKKKLLCYLKVYSKAIRKRVLFLYK